MAILNRDDTEFKTVDKVFMNRGNSTRIQKVWVHNGTTYVLVKGRVLEAVWEKDLSTYGGMSWDGSYDKTPDNNIFRSMVILDNGDLLGVVPYVVNNNSEHSYSSGRHALLQLSSADGTLSPFSTYTSWPSWTAVATGYEFTAQPIGIIECNGYYIAYSSHGIFYSFSSRGTYTSKYENETWHTVGTSKNMPEYLNYGVHVDCNQKKRCIYYAYSDTNEKDYDSSSYMTSIYRIGFSTHSYFYTPCRHYEGEREARYFSFCTDVVLDKEQENAVAFFSGKSGYSSQLVVFTCHTSYEMSSTDFNTTCSLTLEKDEYLAAAKDGYVYTIDVNGHIKKRKISDLSLVWTVYAPSVYASSGSDCEYIHQPLPECDGGFMLPNGSVLYPDGYISKGRKVFSNSNYASPVQSFCFNESMGIGYMFGYSSSVPQCSVVKFKEVKK